MKFSISTTPRAVNLPKGVRFSGGNALLASLRETGTERSLVPQVADAAAREQQLQTQLSTYLAKSARGDSLPLLERIGSGYALDEWQDLSSAKSSGR